MLILTLLFSFSVSLVTQTSNPLPNWLDPSREVLLQDSLGLIGLAPFQDSPPPSNFRVPAEYEPSSTVILSWSGFEGLLEGIVKAAVNQGNVSVVAAKGPKSISGLSDPSRYKSASIPTDTVWIRDYGPVGIVQGSNGQASVGIVDTIYRHYQYRKKDDVFPSTFAKLNAIASYNLPLILDGGNFMVDSFGNLFMTKRTYSWNSDKLKSQVDSLLKSFFNVTNIYEFDYAGFPNNPTDGTGHIDMFMKLLADDVVLIAEAVEEPFNSILTKAASFFKDRIAPTGKKYKVLRCPSWVDQGTWYTFTNSLLVNKAIIMPSFDGKEKLEAVAKAAYLEGMGMGHIVIPVPSDDSIKQGGSVHCVTQLIPRL